jgi:uncharacterized protein (TIGR03083 family)
MAEPTPDDVAIVDRLDEVWSSIDALCADLSEAEWKTETECPGWSVQDNVTHLFAIESGLLGRPPPDHDPPELAHIKNDMGRANEIWVDAWRSRAGADALAEFRDVTDARIAALRGLDEAGFAAESWTPAGPGTVRDLLPFRVFDSWVHEQDMRRALGRPADPSTPGAAFALGRITGTLPYVVGKKVAPPDGTVVVFEITDGPVGTIAITVRDGRAHVLDDVPAAPTVRLTMDTDTLARLGTGRGDPAEIVASGAVRFDGDEALGRRVTEAMNFLF